MFALLLSEEVTLTQLLLDTNYLSMHTNMHTLILRSQLKLPLCLLTQLHQIALLCKFCLSQRNVVHNANTSCLGTNTQSGRVSSPLALYVCGWTVSGRRSTWELPLGSDPQPSCCEVTALTTEPTYRPYSLYPVMKWSWLTGRISFCHSRDSSVVA